VPQNAHKNLAITRRCKLKVAYRNPHVKESLRSVKILATLSFLCLFAASSARATLVYWSLDPSRTADTADSASHTFLSSSSSIAGNGYGGGWQSHTPRGEDHEFGQTVIGSAGLAQHQWRENGFLSTQPVRLDVNSILPQGDTEERLQLGSVPGISNDAFAILASSTFRDSRGPTGAINSGTSEMVLARIANLTNGKLTSPGSVSGTMMTVPFQATLTPVPEISALFPIIGLIAAVAVTQFLRRRRIAQVRASSFDPN